MLCFDNNEGGVIKQLIGAIFVNISYLQSYFEIFTSAGGDISFLLGGSNSTEHAHQPSAVTVAQSKQDK